MKTLLLSSLLLISLNYVIAQDISYSQFYNNPIYLNPALAGGNHGSPRINFNSRLQNASLSNRSSYRTLSTDWYAEKLHGGLALQLTNNVSGNNVIVGNSLGLGYSFHQKLSEKYTLLVGVQVGWSQNFINWNKVTFGGTIEPTAGYFYPSQNSPSGKILDNGWGTKGFFDINSGIAITSENLYGGIAVKHLNTPKNSFVNGSGRLPVLFVGHAGTNIKVGERFMLSPNAMYTSQSGFNSTTLGLNIHYRMFTVGTFARGRDALILTLGIEKERFRIQYSYDHGISELSNNSFRTHESSIMFSF